MSLFSDLNSIYTIKQEIKSAIESKGVDMTSYSFPDYPTAIGEIQTGGLTETLSVSSNGTYYPVPGVDGFSQVYVDVPQSVSGYTEKDITEGLSTLTSLNNSASFIASSAFYFNSIIQTVNLPNCTYVGSHAFYYASGVVSVSLPVCETLYTGAFSMAFSLNNIYLPECSSLWAGTLRGTALQSVNLPKVVTLPASTFQACGSLASVSLPICERIDGSAFKQCASLQSIVLPMVTSIANFAFDSCTLLSQITLGASSVCHLDGTPAFRGTPISSGTGSIYVPESLVSDYKADGTWSYFESQIFSIPE